MRDAAAAQGADLVLFSELVLVGYPPEDLVLRPALVDAAAAALRELERESASGGPAMLVTLPWRADGCLHNAAALVSDGRSELRSEERRVGKEWRCRWWAEHEKK